MAYALDTYTSSGEATFTITFPYLDDDHVLLYVDGVSKTYTLDSATVLRPDVTPTSGQVVTIERSSSRGTRLVDYVDASVFKADTLDNDLLQAFYVSQEAFDQLESTLGLHSDGTNWDAEGVRIRNVADASADDDVPSYGQINTSVTAAAASASAAATSETNAATSETNAAASASAASTSETNAATSESNASTSETNAATSASNASTSETNAAASAAAAATSYDDFDDRYLGSKTADPALDNDGNALVEGAMYWHSTDNRLHWYDGAAWQDPVTDAAASASAASTSESNAATSETNAATSETNAAASEAALDGLLLDLNAQTGTTYTLALTDQNSIVTMDNASANTLTVPPNSSVAFGVGTSVDIFQKGAGQTTIAAGSGVTIRTPATLKLTGQYSACSLLKIATDEWFIAGDLALS